MDLYEPIKTGNLCDGCSECMFPENRSSISGKIFLKGCLFPCPVAKERVRKSMFNVFCEKMNLVNRDNVGLSDYKGESDIAKKLRVMVDSCKEFLGENFYFWGKNGTQKTTMLKAYGRDVLWKLFPDTSFCGVQDFEVCSHIIQFIRMGDALDIYRKLNFTMFDSEEDKFSLLHAKELIEGCTILIIDECFDPSKMTTSTTSGELIQTIDSFLRDRLCDKNKTTIFISNVPIEKIDESRFGISLKSLVERECSYVEQFTDVYSRPKKRLVITTN